MVPLKVVMAEKKQPKLSTSASAATTNTGCYGGLRPLIFGFITETPDNSLFNNMSSDHLFLSSGKTETDVVVPTTPTVHAVGAFEN